MLAFYLLKQLLRLADNDNQMTVFHPTNNAGRRLRRVWLDYTRGTLVILLIWMLAACGSASQAAKPVVSVITPVEGARFGVGEVITLQVAAASSNNVERIELRANNAIAGTATNPEPSPTFSSHIDFTPPQAGSYAFAVLAYDATGTVSDPFLLNVLVGEEPLFSVPQPTQPVPPTTTPPPGIVGGNGCDLSAQFVADVTIPDGTEVPAGKPFVKTWRLRNTSSCAWENGYKLKFLSDEIMGAAPELSIPPTPKDAEVDISVQLMAPSMAGVYTSTWRLLEPGGKLFGNRLWASVKVP